eukprot:12414869-Karenia_brevis.AAC.1
MTEHYHSFMLRAPELTRDLEQDGGAIVRMARLLPQVSNEARCSHILGLHQHPTLQRALRNDRALPRS